MTIYIAECHDWDGVQEYHLFSTFEAASAFVAKQTGNKLYWGVEEKVLDEES